jgi:hypothetical protein
MGSGSNKGRILCLYTRSYTAGQLAAVFNGTLWLEGNQSVSDAVNSWAVSGDDGSHTGTNLNVSFGSGGGTKQFYAFSVQKSGDVYIAGSVAAVQAFGDTIVEGFTLPAGALAPYLLNSNYTAVAITATSMTTSSLAASGNASALNGTQIEYNTAASSSGSTIKTATSYTNMTVTGLKRGTLYYFRMRVRNVDYGYGAWGTWRAFRTLTTVPGAPDATWLIDNIDQTSAAISANTVADDGAVALDGWDVQYNTTETDVGATTVTTTSGVLAGPLVGLIPGTAYSVRIRAKNSNGYGPYSAWKVFTTLPGVYVKPDTEWKNAIPYVNPDGLGWRPAVRYVNVDGVWKQ